MNERYEPAEIESAAQRAWEAAGAFVAREDADMSAKLGLDASSRIFVIGTEGATDPELYHQLVSQ